jgi:hypothetical protein
VSDAVLSRELPQECAHQAAVKPLLQVRVKALALARASGCWGGSTWSSRQDQFR